MTKRVEFDHGLEELKELLLGMGARVEKAIMTAMDALQAVDVVKAKLVIREDPEINQLEDRWVRGAKEARGSK